MNFELRIYIAIACMILTSYTFYRFVKMYKILKDGKDNLVQLRTNNWYFALAIPLPLIHVISKDGFNIWTIASIILLIPYVILSYLQENKINYLIDSKEILNVNKNKSIPSSIITEIQYESNSISIHTSKFRNDLIIDRSKLHAPSWQDLETKLKELYKI